MSRRLHLVLLLVLVAGNAGANCIANGHFAIGSPLVPLGGTLFPYTEDITHTPSNAPVGGHLTVRYNPKLEWTRIQSGCSDYGETNINASADFNLQVRAAPYIAYDPPPTAPRGTRYEVQMRLGLTPDDPNPRIASWEMRRLEGRYPYTERFGGSLQNVPAGNYVLSMWARLLDGPETNAITFDLQWMTGQGVPAVYPADRRWTGIPDRVTTRWAPIGAELAFESTRSLDLSLQGTFQMATGTPGATLDIGWSLDGASSGEQWGSLAVPEADLLPAGRVVYDDKVVVLPGRHTLRMWARTTAGEVRLDYTVAELFSFAAYEQAPNILPMTQAIRTDRIRVGTDPDNPQPIAMSPICGRWTKLLDFTLQPNDYEWDYSWMLNGYVEILGNAEGSSDANFAIQVIHTEPTQGDPTMTFDHSTDMGIFDVQVTNAPGGLFLYGDASKWGNWIYGANISLWGRKLEGCRGATFGGGFDVGKRWLAVKLIPSMGDHL